MHSATVAKLHAAQPKVEEGITRPLQPQEAQNGAKPKLGEVQQQRAPYRPPQALPGGQGNSQGGKQPYCPPSYRPPSTASLQLPTSTSSSSAPRPFQPQPIQQAEARQLNPSPIAPPMGILPPRTAYMAPSQPYMPAFVMQTGPAWHAGGPPSLGPMMALPPGAMGSPTGWWPVQSVGMVPAPTQGIPIMLHEGMPPPPFHHHPAQAHIMATQMIPPPRPPPPTDPVPAGGELQAEPRAEAAAPVRQWEDASTSGWTQWAMGVHQGPRGPRQDRSRVVGEDQGPGENEPTASSALPPLPKDNQDEGVNQKRAEAEQPEYRKGYCRICRVNKSGYALPGCSHYGPCLSCVPDNSVDMYPTCLQCNQAVAKMIRIY